MPKLTYNVKDICRCAKGQTMTAQILKLENRAVLRLKGADIRDFLQGLVTNDVMLAAPGKAIYAALLTPQGKFMFDMIIVATGSGDGDDLLLDIEADRKPQLMQRLMMYKLRADVTITEEDTSVWALWDGSAEGGTSYTDPRHKALHQRVISAENPYPNAAPLALDSYEERRIRHGVPDGSRDMAVEKYFWLETAAEKLNGVSFTKGCYVGQELTARMKHRTNLKKMLVPVKLGGAAHTGDKITTEAGKNAGEIRTVSGSYALAYLRLAFQDEPLNVGDTPVSTQLP
jgi:tRNA-modifying protein YgfZ